MITLASFPNCHVKRRVMHRPGTNACPYVQLRGVQPAPGMKVTASDGCSYAKAQGATNIPVLCTRGPLAAPVLHMRILRPRTGNRPRVEVVLRLVLSDALSNRKGILLVSLRRLRHPPGCLCLAVTTYPMTARKGLGLDRRAKTIAIHNPLGRRVVDATSKVLSFRATRELGTLLAALSGDARPLSDSTLLLPVLKET